MLEGTDKRCIEGSKDVQSILMVEKDHNSTNEATKEEEYFVDKGERVNEDGTHEKTPTIEGLKYSTM